MSNNQRVLRGWCWENAGFLLLLLYFLSLQLLCFKTLAFLVSTMNVVMEHAVRAVFLSLSRILKFSLLFVKMEIWNFFRPNLSFLYANSSDSFAKKLRFSVFFSRETGIVGVCLCVCVWEWILLVGLGGLQRNEWRRTEEEEWISRRDLIGCDRWNRSHNSQVQSTSANYRIIVRGD